MHARTHELLDHLTASHAVLLAAVAAVPEGERERRAQDGGWSVANVLSHLARVETQLAVLLQRELRRALAAGDLPPAPDGSVLATIDGARLVDRTTRLVAPAQAAPDPEATAPAASAALDEARERTRKLLLAADGLDTRALRHKHFVLGDLTFEQWIAFLGFHERRHAAQIGAAQR